MRQVGRSVQCRQNRRGRTAATWPFCSHPRRIAVESSGICYDPRGVFGCVHFLTFSMNEQKLRQT